jgi:hypothetical protein
MGATWQPMPGPHGISPFVENDAMCQTLIRPRVCRGVCTVMPSHQSYCHVSMPLYLPCKPVPRVTLWVVQMNLSYVPSPATCHLHMLPHHLYDHRACTVSLPRGTVGLYSHQFFFPVWVFDQNVISFAYEARLTK